MLLLELVAQEVSNSLTLNLRVRSSTQDHRFRRQAPDVLIRRCDFCFSKWIFGTACGCNCMSIIFRKICLCYWIAGLAFHDGYGSERGVILWSRRLCGSMVVVAGVFSNCNCLQQTDIVTSYFAKAHWSCQMALSCLNNARLQTSSCSSWAGNTSAEHDCIESLACQDCLLLRLILCTASQDIERCGSGSI